MARVTTLNRIENRSMRLEFFYQVRVFKALEY